VTTGVVQVGGASQPGADAERYRCACWLAGRSDGYQCGFDWGLPSFILLLLHYIRLTTFLFGTTWVSRYQKGKPFWILLQQEMMGWQWHQLDHMQIICTSLQTYSHASTPSLIQYNKILVLMTRMVNHYRAESEARAVAMDKIVW